MAKLFVAITVEGDLYGVFESALAFEHKYAETNGATGEYVIMCDCVEDHTFVYVEYSTGGSSLDDITDGGYRVTEVDVANLAWIV